MRWRSTTLRAPASRPWVGSQALLDSCNARTEIYKCKCMTPKCSPSYHCKNQTWQKIVRFVFQVSLRWQVNRSQSSSSGLSSLMPSVLLSAIHGETRHWYLTKLEPKAYRDTMQVLILYILYIYANMSSDYIKYLFLVALEICRLIGPHRWWLSSTICHLCSAIRLSAQHHHRSALQSLWWRFLVMDLARECMVDRIRCHKCTCCMYFRIHPCMRSLSSKKHIYIVSVMLGS